MATSDYSSPSLLPWQPPQSFNGAPPLPFWSLFIGGPSPDASGAWCTLQYNPTVGLYLWDVHYTNRVERRDYWRASQCATVLEAEYAVIAALAELTGGAML
jgi:hypothetical protein